MKRFEGLENDINYINFIGTRDRMIAMLKDDNFDVDRVKFMLWYLDEQRSKLDELVAFNYCKDKEKNGVSDDASK